VFRFSFLAFMVSDFVFRVPYSGSRVSGCRIRIWNSGCEFRVLCFVFRDSASRVSCFVMQVACFVFRISCFVFRILGSMIRVWRSEVWTSGFGFRVFGSVVRVSGFEFRNLGVGCRGDRRPLHPQAHRSDKKHLDVYGCLIRTGDD